MFYKITDITDHSGKTRTDGRYPLRIGRTGIFFYEPEVGKRLVFEYYSNADGSEYNAFLSTSPVQKYMVDTKGNVIVYTLNSVYKFAGV